MLTDFDYLAKGDFVYRWPLPLVAASAQGCTITDTQGNAWLDLEAANGALLFGYDDRIIREVLADWASLPSAPSFVETDYRRRFARALGQRVEKEIGLRGYLAFENSGAQGVELAVRIAARHQGARKTILVLEGCYHGRSIFASSISSSFRYRKHLQQSGYRVVRIPVPDQDKAQPAELDAAMALAERMICQESLGVGEDALALIYEPILNVSGLLNPGEKFVNHVLKCARSVGAMLIADEIFTGYHKTGPFLSSSRFAEVCDFLVVSKAISNGFCPMSAVWGQEKWMDEEGFPAGEYSTTFSSTPLNFIVALNVLNRVNTLPRDAVSKISSRLDVICGKVIECASVDGFSYRVNGLTAYVEHSDPDVVMELNKQLRAKHLLVASTGMSKTRLLLHPPIVFSENDLDETIWRLCRGTTSRLKPREDVL